MTIYAKLVNDSIGARIDAVLDLDGVPSDPGYTELPSGLWPGWGSSPSRGLRPYLVGGSSIEWHDPRSLLASKASKRQQINLWRTFANESTFPFAGKTFQCDRLSRGDIDGVNGWISITGNLPSNFPGAWKAFDNSYVLIPDVSTWIAFYGAMIGQGTANFSRAQALKTYLDSSEADTIAKVEAINWNMEL